MRQTMLRSFLFLLCTVLAGCSATKAKRRSLTAECDWLAATYEAKGKAGDGLQDTYRTAAAQLQALGRLLSSSAGARVQSDALTQAQREINRISAGVLDAEARFERRNQLLGRLRERGDQLAETARETSNRADSETDADKRKKLENEVLTLLAAARELAGSVVDLAGKGNRPAKFDEATLRAATAVLAATSAPGQSAQERHTALAAKVAGLTERVKLRLEAERKKQADSSLVKRLERASSLIADAHQQLFDKANKPVLLASVLAQVEELVAATEAELSRVDADIVLLTSPWFRVHAGVVTIAPYVLRQVDGHAPGGGSRYRLAHADKTTAAYLSMDFMNRRAWLQPDQFAETTGDFGLRWFPRWLTPDDYEVRVRLTDESNEIDNTETAAGGDWSLDGSTGWNLLAFGLSDQRACEHQPELKRRARGTMNLELAGGLVTDREAFDSHSHLQGGLSTVWAFPIRLGDNVWRTATLFSFLGYGVQEFPALDVDDQQHLHGERAMFHRFGSLAVRLDLTVPLGENFEFVLGGRLWDPLSESNAPENWSLFAGVSVPLGKMFRAAFE
ncbi:MAG: hypothetical protein IPK26_24085 [Planctomycetes bacterium]|nr:hypothetical protein [Planctomycetota bacterium]